MRFACTIAVILAFGSSIACAATNKVLLSSEQRAKISALRVHAMVIQDEVIVAIQATDSAAAAGAVGGLLGAAIGIAADSSITNSRVRESQQTLSRFYASIDDVDYRRDFDNIVRRELSSNYSTKVSQVTTTPRKLTDAELARLRGELTEGQALLVLSPQYLLTMDFRNLDVETVVTVWSKGSDEPALLHRRVLYYQSPSVGPGGKVSSDLWSAQNAALYRGALQDSIRETISLIRMEADLETSPSVARETVVQMFNAGNKMRKIKGGKINETETRITVLGSDNKIYSLPKRDTSTTNAGQ